MENEIQEEIITMDFRALLGVLWRNKWLIICITLVFVFGGAFYAFTAREEFVSQGKILPELSNGNSKNLGGLAGLAALGGIDLDAGSSSSDAIRPDLYPDIIESSTFYLSLLKQKFQTKDADSLIFEDYYHKVLEGNKKPKQSNLELFKARPIGVIVLNRITEERIKDLKKRVSAIYDKKSGVILISAKMPDPIMAAQIAHYTMNYLTSYVTDYRTEKLKQEVDFLGRKVASARGDFYKDQTRRASYSDQFSAPTIRMKSADIQRERLESEYKLSAGVYNELLKKFEESKIRLQQETPVFQVLDSPSASNLRSEPQRVILLLISAVSGFVFATGVFIIGNYRKIFFKEKISPLL